MHWLRVLWPLAISMGALQPFVSSAQAAAGVQLRWQAPAECMSETSARRNLLAHLRPSSITQRAVVAFVLVTQEADSYRARIRFSGDLSGTRELRGTRCDSVSDAAVLIVAMSLAQRATRALPRPARDAADASALVWQLTAAVHGDVGSLPAPTLGPSLQLRLWLSRVQIELGAEWFWPREQLRGPRAGSGAVLSLWDASLGVGVSLVQTRLVHAGPALVLAAGATSGRALNISQPRPAQYVPWAASLLALQVQLQSGSFALRASAELGLTLVGPEFTLDAYGRVFRSSLVFGRLGLGAAWTFR